MAADDRPSLDETLMRIAWMWSRRSTCDRAHIGAVLARDGRAISSGYNGALPGMRHCDHGGLDPTDTCTRANHAERNCIAFAARHGVRTEGSTIYTTFSPCAACGLELIAAGIVRVVYDIPYRVDEPTYSGLPILGEAGIQIDRVSVDD